MGQRTVPIPMRRFYLERAEDVSGISGTGRVAEGIEFANGMVAMTWFSPYPCVNVYPNVKIVEQLHGHEGRTRVVWLDPV